VAKGEVHAWRLRQKIDIDGEVYGREIRAFVEIGG
jgi:hypothetical protein